MKLSLSWLKAYLETDRSLETITDMLTSIGLEVEAVDKGEIYNGLTIAKVLAAEKHPNADRLQVLKVDIGKKEPIQVVCGAPNARKGLIGVFAPAGTYIPGLDTVLSVGKIRDVESFGMMCSEQELLLSEEHDGIIDLDEDVLTSGRAKIGMPFATYAELDDPIIDIGLTPNRADCASVYGIARDLAASGIGHLKPLNIADLKTKTDAKKLTITVDDKKNCTGFAAVQIDNIENRASPEWMQKRLRSVDLKPKNALVDITNYSTFAYGRPLHVFDADKLQGHLQVRKAQQGETLEALDGKTYELTSDMTVVADDSGAIALAGVMGGVSTGCDENTRSVVIESALWKPLAIARAGRETGIVSDARYRYERGVDPEFMLSGLEKAIVQIIETCATKETKTGAITIAHQTEQVAQEIAFPLSEVKRLTGLEISADKAKEILQKLGFKISDNAASAETVNVSAPSWRADINGKADLVEEILRIYGLDKITPQPLPANYADSKILTELQTKSRDARRALAARGMNETVTYSFISQEEAQLFGGGKEPLKLANPIAANMSDMRPSILPSLLSAAKRNSDRGMADIALFEVADIYNIDKGAGQQRAATGLRTGTAKLEGAGRIWSNKVEEVTCFDAKVDALAVLEALGLDAEKVQIEQGGPSWYHPGRSGTLKLGPKNILGWFGEFHPEVIEKFSLSKGTTAAVCGFEILLEALPKARKKATKTKPALNLSPFQQVKRDFSFVVDKDVSAAGILRAASGADKKLITQCHVFDVFEGATIGEDKKAVGIEVIIQPQTASLTDDQLEALSNKIIDNVLKTTKGSLR